MNKLLLAIIVFSLILLLSITLLSGVITAQPPLPSGAEAKARWWPNDLSPVPLPHSPSPALGNRTPSSLSTTTGLPDWTRIAFQSYRDGNWEIYLARGDGSQPVRLTDHPAADMRPRLNRGATRLAFTTDRDGNLEIYAMNTDGSGLARLTFHGASDTGPAWSPDGSRIAFASDRDGNREIYAMNADGSAQTRLTYNSADDLMPAWSPDGNRIAWVRRSGFDGAIWVMDADGGNPRPLTGNLRFLQHPAWSPDGTRLAFDYDADGDFWNELAMVNADGAGRQTVYDPSRNLVDAWMGSWSPDGEWLLFSWVEYVIQDDELFFRSTYIERASATGWWVERLPGSGYDLLPDWETADISPPRVYLQPLPRYLRSRDGAIPLQWSGGDVGPAGLRSYDVQYWEEPSGPWLTLLDHALTRSATLMGTLGHTYAFRARARDYAGNVSPWSGGLRNRTTLYAWHLIGTVTDSRGVPTGGAAVETVPTSLNTASSGLDGRFQVYLAEVASTTVTVGKEGYGPLPPVAFSGENDAAHWWALPPTDERLANGGFEAGTLAPWQASGSFPVALDRSLAHTGGTSAMLGQPLTLEVTNISNNSDSSGFFGPPRIARDRAGNLHVVWADMSAIPGDMTSGTGDIFYSMQSPNGTWITPAIIAPQHRGGSNRPDLAVGPDGTVHVVWMDWSYETVNMSYASKPPGGAWSPLYDLSGPFPTPSFPVHSSSPVIAVDGQGRLHVVWSEGVGIWYASKGAEEPWSSPGQIFPTGHMPTLAIGPDNQLHLVWRDWDSGDIFYSSRPLDGSWIAPVNVTNNSGPRYGLRLAVDLQGRIHLIWIDSSPGFYTVLYAQRSADGNWSEAIPVSDDDRRYPVDDCLAADPDGRIHVAWTSRDRPNNITSEVRYRVRSLDGPWSAPVRISRDQAWADGPGLWADARGQAHIVWYEGPPNGNTEVLYTSVELARAGDATLTQAVTLPVDLHRPTLSFAYRLDIVAGTGGYLEAAVNGTPVFSATVPTEDWTHAWVDLSAWTGQAVTVSFIAHRTEVSGPVVAHLDDVSLGSWLTPVIHDVSPSHTEAWAATPITVTGENFIATPALRLDETPLDDVQWVDERTLTATLPADVPPGVYNVWVTNPGGQEAVLPGGLRAGWQVYLPAVLKGYTP